MKKVFVTSSSIRLLRVPAVDQQPALADTGKWEMGTGAMVSDRGHERGGFFSPSPSATAMK